MAPQILGILITLAGMLWVLFTMNSFDRQPVVTLIGVVGVLGGLVLWALGRIECAVRPPSEEARRAVMWISIVLLALVLLAVIAMAVIQFLPRSSSAGAP